MNNEFGINDLNVAGQTPPNELVNTQNDNLGLTDAVAAGNINLRCKQLLRTTVEAAQKIADETGKQLSYVWSAAGFTSSPPNLQWLQDNISVNEKPRGYYLDAKRLYFAEHMRNELSA